MSMSTRYAVASLTAISSLVLFTSPVFAQEIRRYGDQGGGSSSSSSGGGGGGGSGRMTYPGAPRPQSQGNQGNQGNQQNNARQQKKQQEGEGEEISESYAIKIHEPGNRFDQQQNDQEGEEQPDMFDQPADKIYRGVIPGARDQVDHLEQEASGASGSSLNRLTWIGFQPKDDKSRIFLQFARSPEYSVSRRDDGKTIAVKLDRTQVAAGNFRRQIDTRFFERAIRRIDTEVTGSETVELLIRLEEQKSPSIETDGNYLYVDFSYEKPKSNESGE
jgi:hypothetical protein